MKKIILFLFITSTVAAGFGQVDETEQVKPKKSDEIMTLLGSSNAVGGYGGLSMLYTQIDNKDAFVFGARGGAIMGHSFAIGFGGCGFVTDLFFDEALNLDANLAGGYGGLFFEPIILPKFPVHLSIPVLIGAGGIAYNSVDRRWEESWYVEDSEAFFVVEPGAEIELNITRFFRFSIGAYYRHTSNIDLMDNVSKDVLNGFSYGVNFKFGKF
ncbi:MAG: hypothetical protein JW723_04260 [Bacteroidales bacterium]|nr:hypothetical protein [Bacteroidales bacterium]